MRNSATPWLASEPRKEKPAGSLMPQAENVTGMDPAASSFGPSRRAVIVNVTTCEHAHQAQVAQAWELLAGLFGYRLRSESGATFQTLAALLDATMRGLVVMALSMPDLASYRALAVALIAGKDDIRRFHRMRAI
jgi:hypothetical protein